MLQRMQQRIPGIVTWIIVIMIGAAFAIFGLSDYFSLRGDTQVAAKVNGKKITWASIDTIYHRMQRQLGERHKDNAKTLKEQLRYALVQRAALLDSIKQLGFSLNELQVAETLLTIPTFQIDGKFSKEKYMEILESAGYTDNGFRNELADDVLLAQLEQGIQQSSFSLSGELVRLLELLEQRRDIGYVMVPAEKFKAETKVTNEIVKSYYDSHQGSFVVPEKIAVDYAELSVDTLAKNIQPGAEEVKAYYEQHQDSYGSPERVHARHILIALPKETKETKAKDKKAQEEQKVREANAKQEIESILDQLKNGADFETLAKEKSADTVSGKKGGDLGWFTKKQMVAEFEKAAFALEKPNDISKPIRTAFGYHIIQLIEHKKAEVRPFSEVKELAKEQIQREKAQVQFVEKSEQMAKLSFEQADLKSFIALGALIKETPLFTRQGLNTDKVAKHQEVLQKAFTEATIKQEKLSEPIKIDEGVLVVFKLKKHEASRQQDFAEVEKMIQDKLILEQAKNKAKEVAENMQKQIKKGEDPVKLAKDHALNWVKKTKVSRNESEMDKHILQAAFQLPRPKEEGSSSPLVKIINLPNEDYIVLKLDEVHEGDLSKIDDNTRNNYRQSLAEFFGQFEFSLYANKVLSQSKIEMSTQNNIRAEE